MVYTKSSFFEKAITAPFFCKCLPVTQNGHFFPKNVGKMFDKNSENHVLLCENTFYEKWQSGRINFFGGGFSAFMVYALTLISDGVSQHFLFCWYSQQNKKRWETVDKHLAQKKPIYTYSNNSTLPAFSYSVVRGSIGFLFYTSAHHVQYT